MPYGVVWAFRKHRKTFPVGKLICFSSRRTREPSGSLVLAYVTDPLRGTCPDSRHEPTFKLLAHGAAT